MRDLQALRKIKHASSERRAASYLLGFTRATQRCTVAYERQYCKLRLVLLALRAKDSPFARPGVPVDTILGFLVPWRLVVR